MKHARHDSSHDTPHRLALPEPPRPILLTERVYALTVLVVMIGLCGAAFAYVITETREMAYQTTHVSETDTESRVEPFPLGVDPKRKLIVEVPDAETYMRDAQTNRTLAHEGRLFSRLSALLSSFVWYQNIATPSARILVIQPGERKEEIASHTGRILGWSPAERVQFMKLVSSSTPELTDGKFFPGTYVVERHAEPESVARLVQERFRSEVLSRYTDPVEEVVPLSDALTIASLLEREAYDFDDMRLISGVIWNRLFAGMKLQIDATLQYARGSSALSRSWWPTPRPADKKIDSPFNTYQNEGLPPSPIASPSLDAILAALNPKSTDCLFYFHDSRGGFHCTPTYEDHVALLKVHYGRGK